MEDQPNIKLTFNFIDPDLSSDERDEQALRFMKELRAMDEVESVDRVLDPKLPKGSKSFGVF